MSFDADIGGEMIVLDSGRKVNRADLQELIVRKLQVEQKGPFIQDPSFKFTTRFITEKDIYNCIDDSFKETYEQIKRGWTPK